DYFSQSNDTTDALSAACESLTLTAELETRIQAMKMRCYRKVRRISYKGSPCQNSAGNRTT
ncbi:hypothetical protein, partial [Thiolapillus sp.]|uniref:hypothetical protein n=1 Tax=Thiolapillus sp. TaxID=2017437 RepID=UPI003AF7AE24